MYSSLSVHNLSVALTLGTFACVVANPHPNCQVQIDLNDIALGVRLGKLIESAKKHFDKKDHKALIKDMLELKEQAEYLTGNRIDLEQCIDDIFYEAKKKTKKVDSKLQKAVKKIIKDKGKHYDHKAEFMIECYKNGIEYDALTEKELFQQKQALVNIIMGKHSDKEDIKIEVPFKVIIGVTGALAGMFIAIVPAPVPGKDKVATFLITTGVKFVVDGVVEAVEHQKEQDKLRDM